MRVLAIVFSFFALGWAATATANHPCSLQAVPTDGSCQPEIGIISGCPMLNLSLTYTAGGG